MPLQNALRRPDELFDDPSTDEWADWLYRKLWDVRDDYPDGYRMSEIQDIIKINSNRTRKVKDELCLRGDLDSKYHLSGKIYWLSAYHSEPVTAMTEKQQAIYDFIDAKAVHGVATLSTREIATGCGVPYGSIAQAVDAIVYKGFMRVEHTGLRGGNYGQVVRKNKYYPQI